MARKSLLPLLGLGVLLLSPSATARPLKPDGVQSRPAAFENLWSDYWKAKSPKSRSKAASRLIATGIAFEETIASLREGRPYNLDVPKGVRRRSHRVTGGFQHHYALVVPESYSPEIAHSLVVYLHGGVQRPPVKPNERYWPEGLEDAEDGEIVVIPAAWSESVWWEHSQVVNIDAILAATRRVYNVDENRVALMGVSDGGTAAYFQGFRNTTPWASLVALIGHSRVLGNPATGADGEMFPINLSNKPLFVVNTAHDRLYPSIAVAPYLDLFASAGAEIEFRHQPDAGHDLTWWPNEAERINTFVRENPRDPLPDQLAWETERTDRYHRNHWLVIDQLGPVPGAPDLPNYERAAQPGGGPGTIEAFPHERPSGRVEAQRKGNTIATRTRGAQRYRLLLSPREIDFSAPVVIGVNGREVFNALLQPSLPTLFHWAAQDNDRTMLFGAELIIDAVAGTATLVEH